MEFHVADFTLDAGRFELRCRDRRMPVEPKPLQLLLLLAEANERAVSSADLQRALWPDVAVGAGSLHRAVRAARRALGDARGRWVRTVRGRGYRLVTTGAPAIALRSDDSYVGRVGLLDHLERALVRAMDGAGAVVLLGGEPGIGKTRTALELTKRARAMGARAAWTSCETGDPPGSAWRDVVRSVAGAWVFDAEETHPCPFDGVSILERACRAHPWLVVLDDLQWADAPSLLGLRSLARALHGTPLLALGTYRDTALQHPLSAALEDLRRSPGFEHHVLGRLACGESRALVARLAPRDLQRKLGRALVARADGNPLFLRELVNHALATDAATGVPETILQAIRPQLERLPAHTRRVLALAAAAGTRVELAVLAMAARCSRPALEAALEPAQGARILAHASPESEEIVFRHELVREAVLAGLPPSVRARLHRRIAWAHEQARALREGTLTHPLRVVPAHRKRLRG